MTACARQDQEANVVDDQVQAGFALRWALADQPIARCHLPSAGTEPEQCQ